MPAPPSIGSRCSSALLDRLDAEVADIERGTSPLDRYRAACVTIGSEVAVDGSDGRFGGRAVAIDEHGALVVETAAGIVAVTTGDVVRLRHAAPA